MQSTMFPDVKSPQNTTFVNQTFQNTLFSAQPPQLPVLPFVDRMQLQGSNLDKVYTTKNDEINHLKAEIKSKDTQIAQLKKINIKLFDKVDELDAFVQKEASANQFMFNYPPKGGVEDLRIEEEETKDKGITLGETEAEKVKTKYQEIIQTMEKQHNTTLKVVRQSMSSEIESLQEMLSRASYEASLLQIQNRQLTQKSEL